MDTKFSEILKRIFLGTYLRRIIIAFIVFMIGISTFGMVVGNGYIKYTSANKKEIVKEDFRKKLAKFEPIIYADTDGFKQIRNGDMNPEKFKQMYLYEPISIYIIDNKTGIVYTNILINISKNQIENYVRNNTFDYYKKDVNKNINTEALNKDNKLEYLKTPNEFTQYYWYDVNYDKVNYNSPRIMGEFKRAKMFLLASIVYLVWIVVFIFNLGNYIKENGIAGLKKNIKSSSVCINMNRIIFLTKKVLFKIFNLVKKIYIIFESEVNGSSKNIIKSSIILIIYLCVISLSFVIFVDKLCLTFFWILFLIIVISWAVYFNYKRCKYINHVLNSTKLMAKGDFSLEIEKQDNSDIGEIAKNINTIKQGYVKALEEQMKNERLKTELITNVSHDLKTPLTSIINYIGLLQNEDISSEEKKDYIKILQRKSEKLKVLIENLFELSKTSSGNIELNLGKVDIVELIYQVLADYINYMPEKNIKFKVNSFNDNIILNLDGKRISRVIENLVCNAIKYSMNDTRVYIDINEKDNNIVISVKNIASYEMNFDADEIFERFTRADESRNSEIEGSGLGLAIAKSIVELHGGSMYIQKEADMFKAFIELNK